MNHSLQSALLPFPTVRVRFTRVDGKGHRFIPYVGLYPPVQHSIASVRIRSVQDTCLVKASLITRARSLCMAYATLKSVLLIRYIVHVSPFLKLAREDQ